MHASITWFTILASLSQLHQAEAACDLTTSYLIDGGCYPRVAECGGNTTPVIAATDNCRCYNPGSAIPGGRSTCSKGRVSHGAHRCETFGNGPFSSKCIIKCDSGYKLSASNKCVQEDLQGCPDTTQRIGVAPLGSEFGCKCLDINTVDGDDGSLCPTMKAGADGQTHGKSICAVDDAGDGVCKVRCFAPYKQQGPRLCTLPRGK